MTPDELNHLKEAHFSATPDPWYFNTSSHHAEIVDDEDDLVLEMGWTARMDAQEHRDGHLLVEARNAIPALLAEIERLAEENQELKRENQLAWSKGHAAGWDCHIVTMQAADLLPKDQKTSSPYEEKK